MAGSGINWDEVPPLPEAAAGSGIDWSKVPEVSPQMRQLNAIPGQQPLRGFDLEQLRKEGGTGNFGENVAAGLGKFGTDQYLALKGALGLAEPGEAAAKKAIDVPLGHTVGGNVGEIGGAMLEAAAPFGAATRAASMIPRFGGIGTLARTMLPAAAVGAGQGVLTPVENYSLPKQALAGAEEGAVGGVVGAGVGKALSPWKAPISDTVQQYIDTLTKNLPNTKMLAENITDSPRVKMFTNALAQMLGGGNINEVRKQNLGEVTKLATKAAGYETPELSPSASANLHGQLDDVYDYMRRAPPLPANGMAAALNQAQGTSDLASRLVGTNQPAYQLARAEGAVQPLPQPVMPPGVPPAPRITPKIPVETALKVRSELNDQAFRNQQGISSEGAATIRDELDNLLTNRFGALYPETQQQYGRAQAISNVQNTPHGVTPSGQIRPEVYIKDFSDREMANPSSPFTQTMKAAAQRMESPTLSENRSLAVRMLLGGALPGTLAGSGALLGGGTGAMIGAGAGIGTLALARALLGTEGGGRYLTGTNRSEIGRALQSPQMREFLRLLGTSAATEETPQRMP